MSLAPDLARVGAGFRSPALASQQVFRAALDALARPGKITQVAAVAEPPAGLHDAACALALALLDQDTRFWLSPGLLGGAAASYIRFHTGCSHISEAGRADFALAVAAELPLLETFGRGTEDYPDRSASVVIQVDALVEGEGWTLSGPGIKGVARLAVAGLPQHFLEQWKANGALFPRGVDVFFTCGERLCGLPRTTRIEA